MIVQKCYPHYAYCLGLLVQFLTFKSEVFEQNAINKMEIELPSSDVTKQASYAITQGMYICMHACVYVRMYVCMSVCMMYGVALM